AVGFDTGCRLQISRLTLGSHVVRATVASNTSPGGFYPQAFDIITPIYSAKSNLYGDYQNTLMVGSNAISDDRLITPIKDALPATKAWVEALGIIQGPSTSSLLPVPIPDLAATWKGLV